MATRSVTSGERKTVTQTFRKCRRIAGIFSRRSMGRSKVVFPRGNATGGSGISGDSPFMNAPVRTATERSEEGGLCVRFVTTPKGRFPE
jgi:hypothetical protein